MYLLNFSAARTSGTRNYCEGIIEAIIANYKEGEVTIFVPYDLHKKFTSSPTSSVTLRTSFFFRNTILRIMWEQLILPIWIFNLNAKSVFAAFDIAPFLSFVPVILAVRNPSPLYMGRGWGSHSFLVKLRAKLQFYVAYCSVKKAKAVVYPSQFAADSLGEVMDVPMHKRKVVNHGVDENFWRDVHAINLHEESCLSTYNISRDRYFLFVSMLYYYKRPDLLIRAFSINADIFRNQGYKLVIVGGVADVVFASKLKQLIVENDLEDDIYLLGYVPKNHLPILYSKCRAFFLPSIIETFGQPFVEAMTSGAFVVAADMEFSKEICGNGAVYFKQDNVHELSKLMLRIIEDDKFVNLNRGNGMSRSKNFSWTKEALETLQILSNFNKLKVKL